MRALWRVISAPMENIGAFYFSGKTSLAVSKTRFVKQSEKILQNSWGNIW